MNMGDFLKQVTEKRGPEFAANMSKGANLLALQELLISKGIITREELGAELEKQLDRLAKLASLPDSAFEDF